jgi:hypothetical protein
METKINKLFQLVPQGVVMTGKWLHQQGYSPELLRSYRNSHWLEKIGHGAMIRKGDKVDFTGAIFAIQEQLQLKIHVAASTSLVLQGKAHFIYTDPQNIFLFGDEREKLPKWFSKYKWGVNIKFYSSSFLPADIGLKEMEIKNFKIKISNSARALMECLYLSTLPEDFIHTYEMMQGLNNLHLETTKLLLKNCTSVKVKRLFLYMAEKSNHAWFKHIDLSQIDMGKGNRSLVKEGVYISKYRITVPKELEDNAISEL